MAFAAFKDDQTIILFHKAIGFGNQTFKLYLGYVAFKYGVLYLVQVPAAKLQHFAYPFVPNIIDQYYIHVTTTL